MERTNSVIRISRGRLAALLAATVLVSIALFSLIFYHWCLHAKRTEALTQGDGPLWAFEQGELEVVEEDPDGTTVYGGAGYQVQVRDGFVTSVRDDNKGFPKLYEQGVLTSITFDNPLGEAVALCTPFQVDSYVEYPVRTQEEARAIREDIDAEGVDSLRDQGLRCWELDNGYLVTGLHRLTQSKHPGGPQSAGVFSRCSGGRAAFWNAVTAWRSLPER